ncbi:MAG: hypothetical protein JZU52_09980, partial [Lamprocystis purpurea]|nr:hypothetical protein [Lamprocystis purpurea]
MIAGSTTAIIRIYPQMSQMHTDEENICVHLWISFPPECLGERCDSARSRIASARSRSTRTTPIKHCAARMRKVYMEWQCGAARLLPAQFDMVRQQ